MLMGGMERAEINLELTARCTRFSFILKAICG